MSEHSTTAVLSEEHHPLADNLLLKVYTALIILTGITAGASI